MEHRSRSAAFRFHLLISLLALALLSAVVLLAWYPSPYLRMMGAVERLLLMIALGIGLGPLLTLLVYRPGKKGLKFDLIFIAGVQVTAMAVMAGLLYAERPHYMVFAVDRFNILQPGDVYGAIEDDRFLDNPWRGPLMLVATLPTEQAAYEKLMNETLFENLPDLQHRPEFWSLYSEDHDRAMAVGRPLSVLRAARPAADPDVNALVALSGRGEEELVFFPVIGKDEDFAAVLARDDGELIGVVAADPWF